MANRFALKSVRLAFAQGLWIRSKPPRADVSAKEKYRASLIIPRNHPQLPELWSLIKVAAKETFGAKWEAIYKAAEAQQKLCLRDGDLKSDYAGFEGNWYLSASSDIQPTVYGYDPKAGVIAKDSGKVRSGVWVNASIDIYGYTTGSNGVGAGLRGVQLCLTPPGASDESLGGATAAGEDDFEEIGVSAESDPLVA